MRTRGIAWSVGVAAVALGGCAGGRERGGTDEATGEAQGYVVIDGEARAAGYRLDGVDAADSVLPVEVTPFVSRDLVGPHGRASIEPQADEVVYVSGRDGEVHRGVLDADVARDRLLVGGSEAAAKELAEQIDGVVDGRIGSRFLVVGPDALVDGARGFTPDGLDEVLPAALRAGARGPWASAEGAEREAASSADEAAGARRSARIALELAALEADALLPMPVECSDPVEGTWVARIHSPEYGDWYHFTLQIHRSAGNPSRIVGTIVSRSWSGSPDLRAPASCRDLGTSTWRGTFDWTVRMNAEGTYDGATLDVIPVSFAQDSLRCGPEIPSREEYLLDRFTGTLVGGGRLFQAVHNDGGRAVDEANLFRRVSCQ